MATHCERCGNDENGDRIYYCRDCRTYFCDSCIGDDVGEMVRMHLAIIYDAYCPECSDGGYLGRVDRIRSQDSEGLDYDEEERDDDGNPDPDDYPGVDISDDSDYVVDTSYYDSNGQYPAIADAPIPAQPSARELQLLKVAAMSESEWEREITLRIHQEVAKTHPHYMPFSPSTFPLVTREDIIRFTVLNKYPLPHIVYMAESYRKHGRFSDGWGELAGFLVEGLAARNPTVGEAVEGLIDEGGLQRWAFTTNAGDWSLADYVRRRRESQKARFEADEEARNERQRQEAIRRASTVERQLLRLFVTLLALMGIVVFAAFPVLLGRGVRLIFRPKAKWRWLMPLETFLRDARENLPPARILSFIRTGK